MACCGRCFPCAVSALGTCSAKHVYVSLLRYYLWKDKTNELYTFTNADLLRSIGYSTDNKLASSMMTNILESFQREGIIQIENYYEEIITNTGKIVPSPRKKLLFVAQIKSDLKPIE